MMAKSGQSAGPRDETDVAEAVANAAGKKRGLRISGGNSKSGFGHPVDATQTLSTDNLTGITLYEPEALTLVVRAGTPLAEVEKELEQNGQMLPFEPPSYNELYANRAKATIGGTIACGLSGPRRIQAGAARDSLIGVRFVSGEGEIVKSGGRVMKNVTGYDLTKLMCGSHGTLGILTELSFKLLPMPESAGSILLPGLGEHEAVAALSAALTSPYDVSGAAHLPDGPDGQPATLIRVEGFRNSVEYRLEKLHDMLVSFAKPQKLPGKASTRHWRSVRELSPIASGKGSIWRVSVKPTDGPVLVEQLRRSLELQAMYDWGGGLVWLNAGDYEDAGSELIRTTVTRIGGHATLMRAPDEIRQKIGVFQPVPGPVAALSAALRQKFDPHGLLNPGRMGLEPKQPER